MAKRDKYGRTARDLREEARTIGADIPKGADLAGMRRAILAKAEQNTRHNLGRGQNGRGGPEQCKGCH